MRRFCSRLTAMALLAIGFLSSASASALPPNILFIFSDDHAPHAIGAYGGWLKDVAPTPNIDALAREGVLFENSFCTNSICGPSRAVILTGKHSHLNGFVRNGNRFDGAQQTFPKLLQQAGYQTAIVGKWHLESDPTGFDHWQILPGQGSYYNPDFLTSDGKKRYTGHCTDIVTDLAVEWLKSKRDPGKPFLLMCQHKAPHRTWMPALRHLKLFEDRQMPEPATLFDTWKDNASPARHQEMTIDQHMDLVYDLKLTLDPSVGGSLRDPLRTSAEFKPRTALDSNRPRTPDKSGVSDTQRMTAEQRQAWDEHYGALSKAFRQADPRGKDLVRWKYQRYIKDYLQCVKGVDESVGTLRAALKELGLADNTIVIYSSDQGFYLGDHGWYDKRWMYEESLKMPLVVLWPSVTRPGTRIQALVQNLDYAETFLDVAGAPLPADMQGRSLVPLLRGEQTADWRQAIYYHYHEYPAVHMVARHYGIRTSRDKLIRFYQSDEWEFYDLQNDPDELTNEYHNPQYAQRVSELREQLERLRAQYQDNTDVSVMPTPRKKNPR